MIEGLLGKKVGMTHLFGAESRFVPVTVLQVGPCIVTQVRTQERDGYDAVQIGFSEAKQLNKPALGHMKASGARLKYLREFRATDPGELNVGQTLNVLQFQQGDLVDIVATTKGRGFQGVVKRHGFAGGPKSHGQGDRHRAPGSIGAGTYPGRVVKGKAMPGHMGNRRVTVRKLRVESVDEGRNLLLVRGAVPGSRSTLVMVSYAKGVPLAERVVEAPPAPSPVEDEQIQAAQAEVTMPAPEAEAPPEADESVADGEGLPTAASADTASDDDEQKS